MQLHILVAVYAQLTKTPACVFYSQEYKLGIFACKRKKKEKCQRVVQNRLFGETPKSHGFHNSMLCRGCMLQVIKGSLVGETSVLRTFRMSGKELVKERVSQRKS